jgi:hypothetical protein
MGRPIRIKYPSGYTSIIRRGNERKKIFLEDKDRLRFLEIIEDYDDRYGFETENREDM